MESQAHAEVKNINGLSSPGTGLFNTIIMMTAMNVIYDIQLIIILAKSVERSGKNYVICK